MMGRAVSQAFWSAGVAVHLTGGCASQTSGSVISISHTIRRPSLLTTAALQFAGRSARRTGGPPFAGSRTILARRAAGTAALASPDSLANSEPSLAQTSGSSSVGLRIKTVKP